MNWTKQIIRLLVLILLQVLLINNLQLGGWLRPYIYVYCLIVFPISLPQWVNLFIGALIGMVIDIFMNSLGIHMFACILLMQLRPYLLGHLLADKERLTGEINSQQIGIKVFLGYAVVLILIHHICVFMLSAWSLQHIGFTLCLILISSIATLALTVGYDLLRSK